MGHYFRQGTTHILPVGCRAQVAQYCSKSREEVDQSIQRKKYAALRADKDRPDARHAESHHDRRRAGKGA